MRNFKQLSDATMRFLLEVGSRGGVVSVLVLILVGFIVLPLPTFLLDIFLVINIVLGLIVLLRGLSLNEPVRLFSFPTILLFATLFRLALNVSSTRLILTHGIDSGLEAAGQVIGAFGSFVVRGDFVVGCILFLLIAVVNFVVIAKGSARVAEVAARFVLDALPGKQLAIDADMRSGLISQEEASGRREYLTQESQFYGAMDGAMKFVQGDAIAGLVIVFINAVGGIALGTFRGMPMGEAVEVFGVLAIGDGLVNIIPSLLMSLSAGVIVTHVAGRNQRGSGGEMFVQLLSDPSSIFLSGAALLFVAIIPGMEIPFVPFFLVGSLLVLASIWLRKAMHSPQGYAIFSNGESMPALEAEGGASGILPWFGPSAPPALGMNADFAPAPDKLEPGDELNAVCLEIDQGLLASYLRGKESSGEGLPWRSLRVAFERAAEETYRLRGIRLNRLIVAPRPFEQGGYRVLVRTKVVREGTLDVRRVFVSLNPGSLLGFGIGVIGAAPHPLDRRTGSWVSASAAGLEAVQTLGADVYGVEEYLAWDAVGAAYEVIEDVFGLDEVKRLVGDLRGQHERLVEEVFDKGVLSYAECTEILRRLIRERVNVRDLKVILEGVSEFAAAQPDADDRPEWMNELHSFLRIVLARGIVQDALGADDSLRVFVLSREAEDEFRAAIPAWTSRRSRPPVDPGVESRLRENSRRMFNPVIERGNLPVVVLCAADVRQAAHEFFVRQLGAMEWLRTLSYQELGESVRPESVGVIECS